MIDNDLTLTALIYKSNNLDDLPIVKLTSDGKFLVDVTRGSYKVLFLPFIYKNKPVVYK